MVVVFLPMLKQYYMKLNPTCKSVAFTLLSTRKKDVISKKNLTQKWLQFQAIHGTSTELHSFQAKSKTSY